MNEPFNTLSDSYQLWVPIEDTELMKSVEVDENGDYIVQGVMTSDAMDEEDDSITPDGMDCSYFLTKGWIKYEHGNNPNQFIGEPLEVKVGQFEHPKLRKSVNGIFVKGRLFANRELAKQAVKTITDLQKSNTKRCMGWSIEGNVKERDRKSGKIMKSVLRNVVLTMNPVNTTTWAELSKSFAKNHEVEVNMELDKSMDTGAIAEVTPQSLEGSNPEKDPQEEWVKLFRKFVKQNSLRKSMRNQFVASTEGEAGITAYMFAKSEGLDYEGAIEFATYIAERHLTLKSLFRGIGGEKMAKSVSTLANLLDADLEELQKSLELDEEEGSEDEELEKSMGDDDSEDDGEDDQDSDDDKDDDKDDDSDDDSDDEDDDSDDEDEDDDKTEKSLKTDFAKSFGAQEENAQAFEVSDFLANLVDEVGFHMDGFAKSMSLQAKKQDTVIKSLTAIVQVVQDMAIKVEEVSAENADLRKSLGEMLERPVGRKSVVNQREVQTITKSLGNQEGTGRALTRNQISDILVKSFESGDIQGSVVSRFEAGVSLDALGLPEGVKTKLGL